MTPAEAVEPIGKEWDVGNVFFTSYVKGFLMRKHILEH
ncbi:hypothetical protein V202x_15360 [Gimesia aquarii]|uniref:Uncharacterized protein n=1 Tax=Gimesia aquarii TaxID=2527964 RepID=A0A517WSE1_9PLAN|nr:hypothetical protein V202x_15360 [Gimesia aquarii]